MPAPRRARRSPAQPDRPPPRRRTCPPSASVAEVAPPCAPRTACSRSRPATDSGATCRPTPPAPSGRRVATPRRRPRAGRRQPASRSATSNSSLHRRLACCLRTVRAAPRSPSRQRRERARGRRRAVSVTAPAAPRAARSSSRPSVRLREHGLERPPPRRPAATCPRRPAWRARRAARSTAGAVELVRRSPTSRGRPARAPRRRPARSCSGRICRPANMSIARRLWLVTTMSASRARSRAISREALGGHRAALRAEALVRRHRDLPPRRARDTPGRARRGRRSPSPRPTPAAARPAAEPAGLAEPLDRRRVPARPATSNSPSLVGEPAAELVPAQVVAAGPYELPGEAPAEQRLERVGHPGQVAVDDLGLQRQRRRRDHHRPSGPDGVRHRRHQVAQRLAGARAGLHQQVLARCAQRRRHRRPPSPAGPARGSRRRAATAAAAATPPEGRRTSWPSRHAGSRPSHRGRHRWKHLGVGHRTRLAGGRPKT